MCVHADPLSAPGRAEWAAALEAFAGPVIAIATHASPTTARADLVLPGLTMWEQEGTLVSMTGRAQRLRPGAAGPAGAAAGLGAAAGHRPLSRRARPPTTPPPSAFAQTVATHPAFAGLDAWKRSASTVRGSARALSPTTTACRRPPPATALDLVLVHDQFGDAATAASHALRTAFQPPSVRVHPETAAAESVEPGSQVVLVSAAGRSAPLPLVADRRVPEGVVLAPLAAPGAPTEGALHRDNRRLRVRLERS